MDSEGWIDISVIASFNRVQNLTQDYNLVRETMGLSAYLEVNDTKVRVAGWQEFVLPPTPGSSSSQPLYPAAVASTLPALSTPGMRSSAAYSLAASLSNLTLSGDDAATIQRKVTEAVLGTKSTMRQIAELHGNRSGDETIAISEALAALEVSRVKKEHMDEPESSASTTTVGSQAPTESDATPGATGASSPPSSPGGSLLADHPTNGVDFSAIPKTSIAT